MKKILHEFIPRKRDLFSMSSTILAIFGLNVFDVPMGILFFVYIALYTLAMDLIYDRCR